MLSILKKSLGYSGIAVVKLKKKLMLCIFENLKQKYA